MKHFLLFYDFAPDYLERRGALRPAHLAYAAESVARGDLQLGGACVYESPPLGVLLFKVERIETVEAFASADPYVINGLAAQWRVLEWTTVVGAEALTQV